MCFQHLQLNEMILIGHILTVVANGCTAPCHFAGFTVMNESCYEKGQKTREDRTFFVREGETGTVRGRRPASLRVKGDYLKEDPTPPHHC